MLGLFHWIALFSLLGTTWLAAPASAETYPTVPIGRDDVRIVESPRSGLALEIELIRSAQYTIDIANYDNRPDEAVTFPVLSALREAANRGVRVRFLGAWITQALFDPGQRIGHYLLDPPTRVPIQWLNLGGTALQGQGWNLSDGMHEKLWVFDGQRALLTGRGLAQNYLRWLDTSFVVKGALVPQCSEAFNRLWAVARHVQVPYSLPRARFGDPGADPDDWISGFERDDENLPRSWTHYSLPPDSRPSAAEAAEVSAILDWYRQPSVSTDSGARGRVLHFDFMAQTLAFGEEPSSYGMDRRVEALSDPVIDSLAEKIPHAREVRLTSLVPIFHPKLKKALLEAKRNGASISMLVITTIPRMGADLSPVAPGGPVWAVGLPDLDDLLVAGVPIRRFDTSSRSQWVALHRKLAVVDDTVYFGSHNFNLPSTVANDELSIEITDPAFARQAAAVFDSGVASNSAAIDAAEVHADRRSMVYDIMRFFSLECLSFM